MTTKDMFSNGWNGTGRGPSYLRSAAVSIMGGFRVTGAQHRHTNAQVANAVNGWCS